ncbi:MAG: Gfo/Idh/MocA family oxidoreductase [Lentisphaeria bacterium]|nr:Gfo/Idh/MocA family oxidoreductase [Lentisphaeria bacterium]
MDVESLAQLKKLAPFAVRAGIAETGRQRLLQHRNKLAFILITEDISDNSRDEAISDFPCPIYKALTMENIAELFGFKGTKMVGFRRNVLSSQIQRLLHDGIIVVEPLLETTLPEHPCVALFGAGETGLRHAEAWHSCGCRIASFLVKDESEIAVAQSALEKILGYAPKGYISPEEQLQESSPTIVDVCLPNEYHYEGCHFAIRHGCHVLCKTPYGDDPTLSPKEFRKRKDSLVNLAARRKRLLGLATHLDDAIKAFAQGKVFFPLEKENQ